MRDEDVARIVFEATLPPGTDPRDRDGSKTPAELWASMQSDIRGFYIRIANACEQTSLAGRALAAEVSEEDEVTIKDIEKQFSELNALLPEERRKAAAQQLHDIAVSCASFIAEIDANSSDVAAYLEQRLEPLLRLMHGNSRTSARVRTIMERIARDARKLR